MSEKKGPINQEETEMAEALGAAILRDARHMRERDELLPLAEAYQDAVRAWYEMHPGRPLSTTLGALIRLGCMSYEPIPGGDERKREEDRWRWAYGSGPGTLAGDSDV